MDIRKIFPGAKDYEMESRLRETIQDLVQPMGDVIRDNRKRVIVMENRLEEADKKVTTLMERIKDTDKLR